jgi:hypothetical protein
MIQRKIFDRNFHELTGCIHVHSEHSFDCSVPLARILKEARKARLDYITINDHMTTKAADELPEDTGGLTVLVGAEINDPDLNNHYLVFNPHTIINGAQAADYVTAYKEAGATGFVAHPFEYRKSRLFRKYSWTDKDVNDFDGLEVWNYLSSWIAKVRPRMNGLLYVLFPSLLIDNPYRKGIRWWDEMNLQGMRKAAIGSVDAHGECRRLVGIPIHFLTHGALFKTIRTNLLLPAQHPVTQEAILQALRQGNSYIVNYKMGYPYNFYAGMHSSAHQAIFGEEIPFSEDLRFYYRLPKTAKVKLHCNGRRLTKVLGDKGCFPITQPGNYRLEITRNGRGWIYTNMIYVTQ